MLTDTTDPIRASKPEFRLGETTAEELNGMLDITLESEEFSKFIAELNENSNFTPFDIELIRGTVLELAHEIPSSYGISGVDLMELGIKANNPISMMQFVKKIALAVNYITFSSETLKACLRISKSDPFEPSEAHQYLRVSLGRSLDQNGNTLLIPQIVHTDSARGQLKYTIINGVMRGRFPNYLRFMGYNTLTLHPVGFIEL